MNLTYHYHLDMETGGEGDQLKCTHSQDTRYRILHRTPNTTHHTLPYTHEHYSSSVCDHHTYCVWISILAIE